MIIPSNARGNTVCISKGNKYQRCITFSVAIVRGPLDGKSYVAIDLDLKARKMKFIPCEGTLNELPAHKLVKHRANLSVWMPHSLMDGVPNGKYVIHPSASDFIITWPKVNRE